MMRHEGTNRWEADFGAVILAAGYSSRMKVFKPLLPVGEMSAIERLLHVLQEAQIRKVVVVTGHEKRQLAPVLEKAGVLEACNADYDKGMFSSVQKGLSAAGAAFPDVQGFFLMPVDCPLISSSVLGRLMERAVNEAAETGSHTEGYNPCETGSHAGANDSAQFRNFSVPVFEGKKGHPLMIPARYLEEICAYDGPGGLKAITDKYWDRMVRVAVEEEGCLLDMDTPQGYEEILAFLNAGCRREELQTLAAGRRIFLVRHGQTQQHAEKMFIGRYDVPLSDVGRLAAAEMAGQLAEALAAGMDGREVPAETAVRTLYVSPLQRAAETAQIIREVLSRRMPEAGAIHLHQVTDLQEISLGDWDGEKISRIREEYPEAYERRGKDIFAFKIGNKAENFYDVQYRAVKALREILEKDPSRDIILVTHSAVIRALENNLSGMRVDDPWEKIPKNHFRMIQLPRETEI